MKAFLIVIFGGLGSVKGTTVAAYAIGFLEALVALFFGIFWSYPALFIFMIAVLIVRPEGLFGMKEEVAK